MLTNTRKIAAILTLVTLFAAAVGLCALLTQNSMVKMGSMDGMNMRLNMECCAFKDRPEISTALLQYQIPEIFRNTLVVFAMATLFAYILFGLFTSRLNNFYLYVPRSRLAVQIRFGLIGLQRALSGGIIHPKIYSLSIY